MASGSSAGFDLYFFKKADSIWFNSLELWSAHLNDADGYLWVFYSSKALDEQGSMISESKNISSLWRVEKDETGQWRVVSVKKHP